MTSSAGAPRAIVAGHGDFARGIISAVQQISGRGELFAAVSNASLSADALEETIGRAVAAVNARVIFTDLPAGSCTIAARRVAGGRPRLAVVTGANLPMLLEFALKGEVDAAAIDRAVEKGCAAMRGFHAVEVRGVD